MDRRALRRVAPAVYGLAVLVAALFARDALLPVVLVGAVLLGVVHAGLGGVPSGRDRVRRRPRTR